MRELAGAAREGRSVCQQMLMGEGKTTVISPQRLTLAVALGLALVLPLALPLPLIPMPNFFITR